MAKVVNKKSKKKTAVEEAVDLELTEVDGDEEEMDEETDVEELVQAIADEEEEADVDVAEVSVTYANDSEQAVSVIVISDVPRFFMSTVWVDAMKRDTKAKLPKHVAEHLQERGKVKIV